MKSIKQLRKDFMHDDTNLLELNKLCTSLCKEKKKCYKNYHKMCTYKVLAREMTIHKYYKNQ